MLRVENGQNGIFCVTVVAIGNSSRQWLLALSRL